MKTLILIFTFISTIALAGGSRVGTLSVIADGGSHVGTFYVTEGGNSVGTMERIINGKFNLDKPEIIFNFGQNQNEIRLGYGSLVNNQWQIEKIKLPMNLNQIDPAVLTALNESAVTKTWAVIK